MSITLVDGSARLIQDDEAASVPDYATAALDEVLTSFTVLEQCRDVGAAYCDDDT